MRLLVRVCLGLAAWCGVVLLAAALAVLLGFYARVVTPREPPGGEVLVAIPPGSSAGQAVRALVDAGVLAEPHTALTLASVTGGGRDFKAGEYLFDRAQSPAAVLRKLRAGEVLLRQLTIPEGLTRREIAALYERSGFGSAAEFLQASGDPAAIADLDGEANDLEGYLFPDTYALGRSEDAGVLVARMLARFRQVWSELTGSAAAPELGTRGTVTLASLVEKETSLDLERPLVASVYANRLRRGMRLQCDPTVIYALVLEEGFDGDLRRADLKHPSPYNTYVHRGLPPGPIANPGRASLEAALSPADSDYLFFVSTNDGAHVFSKSLREHNEAVRIHQKEYWRRRWREQGGRGQ